MKQLFLACAVAIFVILGEITCRILSSAPSIEEKIDALGRRPQPELRISTADIVIGVLMVSVGLLFLILYRVWDRPDSKSKDGEFRSHLK